MSHKRSIGLHKCPKGLKRYGIHMSFETIAEPCKYHKHHTNDNPYTDPVLYTAGTR